MSRRGASEPKVQDIWSKVLEDLSAAEAEEAKLALKAAGAAKGAAEGDGEKKEGEEGGEAAKKPERTTGRESFVLFVGPKQSGKSSLILQFLNPTKEEVPKPTVALEYTFGRRSNTTSTVKDIAHIWELGGGTHLGALINVPITPQRLSTAVAIVVVDLSMPGDVVSDTMNWLDMLTKRITECGDKIGRSDSAKLTSLKERARDSVGLTSHADARILNPSLVPTVIVAAKYDTLRDMESVKRKPVLQGLRYVAHCHGASLLCVSNREKAQMNHFRALLNHLVFGAEARRTVQLDPSRPLIIPAGADSLEAIGVPPGASKAEMEIGTVESRVARWKAAIEEVHRPQRDPAPTRTMAAESSKYLEPDVDNMFGTKMEEIERYVKEAERKLRAAAKASSGSKSGGGGGSGSSKSRSRRSAK